MCVARGCLRELTHSVRACAGLTFQKSDGQGGLKIKRIKPNSAAAAASNILCPGLRVLSLDDTPLDGITTARQLAALTQVLHACWPQHAYVRICVCMYVHDMYLSGMKGRAFFYNPSIQISQPRRDARSYLCICVCIYIY
jgi:hypothetical protein